MRRSSAKAWRIEVSPRQAEQSRSTKAHDCESSLQNRDSATACPDFKCIALLTAFFSSLRLTSFHHASAHLAMAVLSKPILPASVLSRRLPKGTEKSAKQIIASLTDLYLKNRTKISRTVYLTLFVALLARIRSAVSEQKVAAQQREDLRRQHATTLSNDTSGTGRDGQGQIQEKKRVELNREFFRNLVRLLRIVVPGWRSKELRLLVSHSVFLVARTLISLYVADLDGKLVSSLVRGKGTEFLLGIVWWMVVAVPATFTNSMVCVMYH